MISNIKKYTRCRILIGQNGGVWIEGGVDDISLATKTIEKIEQEAHLIGLTDAIKAWLIAECKAMGRNVDEGIDAEKETADKKEEERGL